MTYDKTETPSADGVDQEQGRNGKDDLDGTVTERGVQGLFGRVSDVFKDGGTVERDDCGGD